tara:strand:- start:1118 stop:1522 length:405 start_codon:yes stop_codon:yes gene_type:complete
MRIAKSRLKEIILEELGSVEEGYREDRTHYAFNTEGNLGRILDLEKRLESLEAQIAEIGEPLEEGILTENPIVAALGQMLKDPKVLAAIAQIVIPMLMKGKGGGGGGTTAPSPSAGLGGGLGDNMKLAMQSAEE